MRRSVRSAGLCQHAASPEHAGDIPNAAVERMRPEEPHEHAEMRAHIVAALRQVHDPEIPVNIYDLGLIYRIDIADDGDVVVDMTLTAPSCPVAGMMPLMVKNAVGEVDGVGLIQVNMVWDPPWSQASMSDEVRLELGLL